MKPYAVSVLLIIVFAGLASCKNYNENFTNKEEGIGKLLKLYDSISSIHYFHVEINGPKSFYIFIDNKTFNSNFFSPQETAHQFEKNNVSYATVLEVVRQMRDLGIISISREHSGCDYFYLGIKDQMFRDRQWQYVVHENFFRHGGCTRYKFPEGSTRITNDVYLELGQSPFA